MALDFHLEGYRFSDEFMAIDSLSAEVLIGAATMQKWRLKLDFENDQVLIDPKVTKLRLLCAASPWIRSERIVRTGQQRSGPERALATRS